MILLNICPKIDKQEWLARRRTSITATDVAKILLFLEDGKSVIHGNRISDFTKQKLNKEPDISGVLQQIFKVGNDVEDRYHSLALKHHKDECVHRNRVYSKGIFLATLDIEIENTEFNKYGKKLFEIKSTSSEKTYSSFIDGDHDSLWQVCAQLYCCDGVYKEATVIMHPVGSIDFLKAARRTVHIGSDRYQAFLKHIDVFGKILNCVSIGKEYFLCDDEEEVKGKVNQDLIDVGEQYISKLLNKKELDVEFKQIEATLLSMLKDSQYEDLKVRGHNMKAITVINKTLIDRYKEPLKEIKKKYKALEEIEIHEKLGVHIYEETEKTHIRTTMLK